MSIVLLESNETVSRLAIKDVPTFVKWYKQNNYTLTFTKVKGLYCNIFTIIIENPEDFEDSYTVKLIPEVTI